MPEVGESPFLQTGGKGLLYTLLDSVTNLIMYRKIFEISCQHSEDVPLQSEKHYETHPSLQPSQQKLEVPSQQARLPTSLIQEASKGQQNQHRRGHGSEALEQIIKERL